MTSKKRVTAHIPGTGGNNLKPYSQVLVRGGGARDLPGVYYTCIRGAMDLDPVKGKRRRRSIYGLERPFDQIKKPRRKYRNI